MINNLYDPSIHCIRCCLNLYHLSTDYQVDSFQGVPARQLQNVLTIEGDQTITGLYDFHSLTTRSK